MEGGDRGGFYGGGFPYFPNSQAYHLDPPPLYTSTPLLTPQNSFALDQSHQKYDNYQGMSNAFGEFSLFNGGIGSSYQQGRVSVIPSLPINQRSLGVDNNFLDEGQLISTWAQVQNYPKYHIIDFSNGGVTNPRRKGDLKGGRNTPKNYTKGTWTKIEDNKLLNLVEEFGTKNWAVISDFMEGRAGKQCRERWFNYLRPHIKTDEWSEDEERILIKAHEELGNKWAEIAKRIQGRTENGIKNHWYAAQRKKTMRIKRKKNEPKTGKPKSTVLRDYIMNRNTTPPHTANLPKNVTKASNLITAAANSSDKNVENVFQMPPTSSYNDPPVPFYDEESSFMQRFLGNTSTSTEPLVQDPLPDMDRTPLEFNENYSMTSSSTINPQTNAEFSTDDYLFDDFDYGDIAFNLEGADASVFPVAL